MKMTLTACILICGISVYCQNKEIVYLSKNDTTQNYYMALKPDSSSKGLVIIFGGFCTTPDEILQETGLPFEARNDGYTVVMPYFLNDCDSIDSKNIYLKGLSSLLPKLIEKYKIPEHKLIIGGHSLGGIRALYYAEMAYKYNNKSYLKPNAVFGVDPPLDLKRLYNGYVRAMTIDTTKRRNSEASMITSRFKKQFGGSPLQKPKAYEMASSFYRDAKDGGNVKFLKSLPVRLYADPDISWHINERNTPVEWTNLADVTACIVQLKLLGNKNAEFVNCLGKGFNPDGTRHPHSFSMLNPKEFMVWIEKIFYRK